MAVRWRPFLVLAVAAGCAVTLGTVPAYAVESSTGACSADGYRAEATVKYRRVESGVYIGSVGLNIDDEAGQRNRVRLAVKRDQKTGFTYTSGRDVTAGPYLFDYRDNPIHVSDDSEEIQLEVTVDFDTKDESGARCTATVRI